MAETILLPIQYLKKKQSQEKPWLVQGHVELAMLVEDSRCGGHGSGWLGLHVWAG